jgi:hypothetical protein
MNGVSCHCNNQPGPFNAVQDNWAFQSSEISKTIIAGEQSTDIEIQTADGDKVTLSSDIKFESTAVTYDELGRTSSSYSRSQAQMVSASATSKLELTIEGTLDEQEKREIKEVLTNLFKMVKDYITGKADTEEIQNFGNLTTISGVKADFDIHASITTAAQFSTNHVARTAVADKPIILEAETANRPAVSKRVDKLTDRMIKAVKDSDIEPSRILERLNRRLSKSSRKSRNKGPAHWRKMQLRQAIMEDFVRKLQELSAKNEVKIKNTDQDAENKVSNPGGPAILAKTSSNSETILNVASQDFHFEVEYSAAQSN